MSSKFVIEGYDINNEALDKYEIYYACIGTKCTVKQEDFEKHHHIKDGEWKCNDKNYCNAILVAREL